MEYNNKLGEPFLPEKNGFKAFSEKLTCRDYQFEIGGTYTVKDTPELCRNGFHFCTLPLDVFRYYPPNARLATVTGEDCVEGADKCCAKTLTVREEISLSSLIHEHANMRRKARHLHSSHIERGPSVVDNAYYCDITNDIGYGMITGRHARITSTYDYYCVVANGGTSNAVTAGANAHATTNGEGSNAITAGNDSNAFSNGYGSHAHTEGTDSHAIAAESESFATTKGFHSVAVTLGANSFASSSGANAHAIACGSGSEAYVKHFGSVAVNLGGGTAKGGLGSWLFLTETYGKQVTNAVAIKIDGKQYFPDTLYFLYGV